MGSKETELRDALKKLRYDLEDFENLLEEATAESYQEGWEQGYQACEEDNGL